jgi:hypothetical protein
VQPESISLVCLSLINTYIKKKIKTKEEWYETKMPNKIPRSVDKVFKKQWKSWPDFLGYSTKPRSRKS